MAYAQYSPAKAMALLVTLAALTFFIKACKNQGPVVPETAYVCESCQKAFRADLTLTPVCPQCQGTGLQPVSLDCPSCPTAFVVWQVKVIGPGKRHIRMTGREEWLDEPPETVVCPQCQARGTAGVDFRYSGQAAMNPDAPKN